MKAFVVATLLLASCSPVATAPTPTPSASSAVGPTAASPSPTATPTATAAAGLTRYTSTELGYTLDLPAGWRRAVCSAGVITGAPLLASDIFVNAPEDEESISGGARLVIVQTVNDEGLTPLAWLQRTAQPDARIEPVTVGQRAGARGLIGATGETYAMAFAARGWIYGIERTYFGAPDREAEGILATLRLLDDATLGRAASATPAPRSIESLVDALANAFAKKDIAAIAEAMTPCITAGAVPGDPRLVSRAAYLKSLAAEFAAGRSVQVQSRPIETDPSYGRFVRSTWSKPGEPEMRVDLLLHAQGDRWSLAAVLIRAFPN